MKIEIGMNCKQVKVIEEYGFDYVGHEFTITKVTEQVIMGKSCGVGFGIDAAKFNEYFELIVEIPEEEINEVIKYDDCKVIRNKNVTVVIFNDGSKGVAKCLPEDRYDEEKGFRIAYIKAQIKSLGKELKHLVK